VANGDRTVSRARWALQIALIAVGATLTATVYEPFYAGTGYLWRVLPFVPIAVLVCVVGARLRPIPATALGTLAFAAAAIELVSRDTLRHGLPTAATATASARALVGGWAAMLSVATPAGLITRLLMAPALATYLAVVVAAALAWRTSSVLAPVAPLIAAEIVALPIIANQPGTRWAEATALLVVLLLLVLARATPASAYRNGHRPRRAAAIRISAGVAMVAAAVVAGTAATGAQPYVRGGHRYDPRDLVRPPLHVQPVLNPLSGIAAQIATTPAPTLFTVSGAPTGMLMPTSVLDGFDGSGWHASGTYLVAGPALASGPTLPHSATVTARVAIADLDGPYLPVIGRPTLIESRLASGAEIGFDAASGVVVTDGVRLAGSAYTVTGLRGLRDPGLARAATADGSAGAVLTDIPTALDRLAGQITASTDGPYAAAAAIESYLRTMPYSPDAATGGSYGLLERMLVPAAPTDFAGDIGAHAAAFAVLAGAQGLPVRIAVGYRVPPPVDGVSAVTTANAYAWDQVFFQGYGWIDFDPTDTTRTAVVPQVPPIVPSTVPVDQSTGRPRRRPNRARPNHLGSRRPGTRRWRSSPIC
jgi:transglutaminase-like putative cysteine protease